MQEWSEYVSDARPVCRYGPLCYQKNPQHRAAYKHPPRKRRPGPPAQGEGEGDGERRVRPRPEPAGEPLRAERAEDAATLQQIEVKEESAEDETPESAAGTLEVSPKKIEYLDTSSDCSSLIKKVFLVDMPDDFYSFWRFYNTENQKDLLKAVNLELIGPFDIMLGALPQVEDAEKYLVHWRFFYDPPEFQAVIKHKGNSEFHIGYFRDSPQEYPIFLGSNDSSKNYTITPISDNIFGTLYLHLLSEKKKSPFTAMHCQRVIDKLKSWAQEHKYSLEPYNTRRRLASIAVTKTFHGAGIVVPYNKSTQLGYRPLAENDATIKKIMSALSSADSEEERDKALSSLQPVITYANIAMDECDFGTGLELGIDLFCSGLAELNASTLATLTTAYTLLNRHTFIKIIQAHLKYRRKGANLSISNLK